MPDYEFEELTCCLITHTGFYKTHQLELN